MVATFGWQPPAPRRGDDGFTAAERRSALALAEALIPGTTQIPGADERTLQQALEIVREVLPQLDKPWRLLHRTLNELARVRTGHAFADLDAPRQQALLRAWQQDPVARTPLTLAALVYKLVHFDRPDVYAAMGGKPNVVKKLESPRWLGQIHDGATWHGEDTVECDVVVVGTGAGGAVVGKELAERGHAVVFVEEGQHYRRDAFDGSSLGAHRRFYRAAVSVGNAPMPIYIGRLFGGSTAVNGGTSFRTPSWVLDRWCEDLKTEAFSPASMARHFQRVADHIDIAPAAQPQAGPMARLMAQACDALGWHQAPILRNVKGCEGNGFCDLGCRTDARRSMNVSYMPMALEHGAICFTGMEATRVLTEGGRVSGIEAHARGHGRKLTVRARTVVLAGGAVPTPLLLLEQNLGNSSGQVGRNLTLHPSTGVSALMAEPVHGDQHIPQAHHSAQFLRDGILLTSAVGDVNMAAQTVQVVGHALMDVLSQVANLATIGVLIADQSRNGRVWRKAGGLPVITYNLTPADNRLMHRGVVAAMELLREAGARRLFPARASRAEVNVADIARYAERVPSPSETGLLSYHPLGTCKMGEDPRQSVIGLDHQSHDVPGLFVVDGSAVPGPLGVNPQWTILAMATRAAEGIDAGLR